MKITIDIDETKMDAKTIQKYKKKTIKQLLAIATLHFNRFIRGRDSVDGFGRCISSGQSLNVPSMNAQAGHYYPAGKYPRLRFNENNVHLQGKSDNYFASGNLINYRKNLIKKIGEDKVKELDLIAEMDKKTPFKWDRIFLIETIEKYKNL